MDGKITAANTNGCVQGTSGSRDSTATDQSSVSEMLRGERVVGYRPCFARAFGGTDCALLLSQLCHWAATPTVRGRGGDGWFWKPQREITEETGLTRRETKTARRRLCALGVLREDLRGLPATLHYRVDAEAICHQLAAALPPPVPTPPPPVPVLPIPDAPFLLVRGGQASLAVCAKLVRTEAPNWIGVSRTSTTESTSEKTQKRTQETSQPQAREVSPSASAGGEPEKTGPGNEKRLGRRGPSLADGQVWVNRSGAARFKAALEAARRRRPAGAEP